MTKSVVIGRIGAPFGVKGWLHVYSFTEPPASILDYRDWCLELNQKHWYRKVQQIRPHADHFVVHLDEMNSPEQAMLFRNADISIPRDLLPRLPKGEYYWADLIGLNVSNTMGQQLGVVENLVETGANDVLVVQGEKGQHWIPYTDETIVQVDIATRTLVVAWEDI